jgi:hypothetical protein
MGVQVNQEALLLIKIRENRESKQANLCNARAPQNPGIAANAKQKMLIIGVISTNKNRLKERIPTADSIKILN